MLRHCERRLLEIASGHQETGSSWSGSPVRGTEHLWESLLVSEGYGAAQYRFQMVRPHLAEILDLPLPQGLQVHPVRSEELYTIWLAAKEAFKKPGGTRKRVGLTAATRTGNRTRRLVPNCGR